MILMEDLDHQKKSLVLLLLKQTQINWKEIFKLKSENKNDNFQTQYCLGSGSVGFSATESSEVSLNGNVYDFSVDYNYIDKTYLLNI